MRNHKKAMKILAFIAAMILIIGVCLLANALCGNPISKMLAERAAETWLEGRFPDSDYYIERVGFNFKDTNYFAHYRSKSSIDTQFTLYINMFGQGYFDTYDSVINGSITARRVDQEYRELTNQIFEQPSFPYGDGICYGHLEIHPRVAIENPDVTDIPHYALIQEELILDHIYDPRELGSRAGCLTVYVDTNTITYAEAAQVLLYIRSQFDRANIPFRAIDFMLQYPLPEDGPRPDTYIGAEDFLYEDIYEEGLEARIAQADAALKAYWAELDAKYK